VAALACHPRTRAQGYSGKADWSVLAQLKAHVGSRFPVIGNGDVKTADDARRMLEQTGVDYVMIGRGALGNPWIFRELTGGARPTTEERGALVLRHFREHLTFQAEGRVLREGQVRDDALIEQQGVKSFRSHLAWYAHGLYGAAQFRARINTLDNRLDAERAVEQFFSGAAVDAQAMSTDQEEIDYRAALG
jgi:tRNA-dihydrouridine synthase